MGELVVSETEADKVTKKFADAAADKSKYAQELIVSGFKSLFLANGGAILALLTVLGNSEASVEVGPLSWSFGCLSVGLTAAMIGQWCAAYQASNGSISLWLESLKALPSSDLNELQSLGNPYDQRSKFFGLGAKTGVVLSLASFITGIFVALDAVV
ncbi:MAG: hypothetical protein AAGK17_00570 [Pseudomonadota bacterium]